MAEEQFSRSWQVVYSLGEKFMALTVVLLSRALDCFASRGPLCCERQRTWIILLESRKRVGRRDKKKKQICCYILSISQRERTARSKKKNKME